MVERVWTVYGLIDPRDRSVFYVGLTTDVTRRVGYHKANPASPAWNVCQVVASGGMEIDVCVFGRFLDKAPAKILEGRLILSLPNLVNSKSFHALPSTTFFPNWKDLSIELDPVEMENWNRVIAGCPKMEPTK